MLNNLLSNSIKFTPSGGRIVIETSMIKSPENNQELVKVAISDSGIGIPSDKMKYVFSKFSQFSSVPEGGTGLGLNIAKAIVESHGGKIWIESPARNAFVSSESIVGGVGHFGTTVYFTLPFIQSQLQPQKPYEAHLFEGKVVN